MNDSLNCLRIRTGKELIKLYADRFGEDESNGRDIIADVLHALHAEGKDSLGELKVAVGHFIEEIEQDL